MNARATLASTPLATATATATERSADAFVHTPSGELAADEGFSRRHIGPSAADVEQMLASLEVPSLAALIEQTVPASIRQARPLDVGPALSEAAALEHVAALASKNQVVTSLIGMGYHDTHTPPVILRNILENPAWYTAYTPYQPEISQGRLEALFNFQTLVCELTGLEVANASLLDEATAAAEAMALARRVAKAPSMNFLVDVDVHPQTRAVLETRAQPLGWTLVTVDSGTDLSAQPCFGALFQYPGSSGEVRDLRAAVDAVHAGGGIAIVAADPLALTVLQPPGEFDADVAVGSTQRFGVPMGFGGPHAAYMAVKQAHQRQLPGRLVGLSVDSHGSPAYRLALQTREQHIRRDKATSNICTAQVLLAVMAAMYAIHHGPQGLRRIASTLLQHTAVLAQGLRRLGVRVVNATFFDTLTVDAGADHAAVLQRAELERLNFRLPDRMHGSAGCGATAGGERGGATAGGERGGATAGGERGEVDAGVAGGGRDARRFFGISLDETTTPSTVEAIWRCFGGSFRFDDIAAEAAAAIPPALRRTSAFLRQPVFHQYRSETELLRYLRKLSDRDLALDRTMIPLGSCTMKLNAAAEMMPITWPAFARLHPFAPAEQAQGYAELCSALEAMLCEITGYAAVSLQPNSGAQGEYAGLLAIRAYHRSRGEPQRDVCLIPASAHGTNPASAALAGMRIVVVRCDARGNVDLDHLAALCTTHAERLAAVMVTYPSTHGVFEEGIRELCDTVHRAGGQVYVDGANLNAQVGLARPADYGADVSHLNLHKTFCIPHGGGGPGMGPIGVKPHLAPFLPRHPLARATRGAENGERRRDGAGASDPSPPRDPAGGAVSAAPLGSASILPIAYMYIRLMGGAGLTRASEIAILSANYLARRLQDHYPVLYRNVRGRVAHECIIDPRPLRGGSGVTVDDIAKRLIDYGFHAPTMSFPVAGTLMIEPTESESKAELDRFCDAMIAIRAEIRAVEEGRLPLADSPLRHAPHTVRDLASEDWGRPYSRREGCLPGATPSTDKYWSPVGRVDNAHGDRQLICSCPPPADTAP